MAAEPHVCLFHRRKSTKVRTKRRHLRKSALFRPTNTVNFDVLNFFSNVFFRNILTGLHPGGYPAVCLSRDCNVRTVPGFFDISFRTQLLFLRNWSSQRALIAESTSAGNIFLSLNMKFFVR